VKLIPKKTAMAGRGGNNLHPDGQVDGGDELLWVVLGSTGRLHAESDVALGHALEVCRLISDRYVESQPACRGRTYSVTENLMNY
jgi:hypothetical protein